MKPKRGYGTVEAWILRDLKKGPLRGSLYLCWPVDNSEYGAVFEIDMDVVKTGRFESKYIDSRYLAEHEVELIPVMPIPDLEQ